MNTADTITADPIWDSTQMDELKTEDKKTRAILYALGRIADEPHIAWYCGVGTQVWSLLTEALAAAHGKSVREIRSAWKPKAAVNPENPKVIRDTAVVASPEFFRRMDRELQGNASKGDWKAWKPDRMLCMDELHHHLRKLGRALRLNDKDRVAEFAADLANIAMKTAEIHGAKDEE
ncbi:MAG: hypothetical protein ACOYM3_15615 [Terrimicrobiaceae bacterium]